MKAYVRIATAISEGTFEDNPWIEIRPDKKILNDDSGKFESYQFSNDDLNEYGIYQVKLVMSTTDTSKIVKIKKLKIIPNKIDNSLKPLQTATIQINKFILDDSTLDRRDEITIPCDFVVENAVCIIESAQDNNAAVAEYTGSVLDAAASYYDRTWAISSDIKRYADGSIFPAYSHKQTGCVARFWITDSSDDVGTHVDGSDTDGYNVRATILMFGRK